MPDDEAQQQERAVLGRLIDRIVDWCQENLAGFWTVWQKVVGKKKAVTELQALLDGLGQAVDA